MDDKEAKKKVLEALTELGKAKDTSDWYALYGILENVERGIRPVMRYIEGTKWE